MAYSTLNVGQKREKYAEALVLTLWDWEMGCKKCDVISLTGLFTEKSRSVKTKLNLHVFALSDLQLLRNSFKLTNLI